MLGPRVEVAEALLGTMGRVTLHLHGATKNRSARTLLSTYTDRLKSQGVGLVVHSDKRTTKAYLDELLALSGTLVLLDESGEHLTSEALADRLKGWRMSAQDIHLAIGPAEGWKDDERRYGHQRLSLSLMTFPHELAAVMLAEQVYRAHEILRGSPYHKP